MGAADFNQGAGAALDKLAAAIRLSPFDDKLRQLLIGRLVEQGDMAEAVAAVSEKARLCGLRPQDGKLFIELHARLLAAGAGAALLDEFLSHPLVREATADLELAADADGHAVWRVADKLIRYGAYDAARAVLEQALVRLPADLLAHRARIRLYFEQGSYSEAAAAANSKHLACGFDGEDTVLLGKLHSIITDMGLRDMAIDAFLTNAAVRSCVADNDKYAGFESLGVDCELGFVQRKLGLEPLGLFRFSGVPFDTLIELLGNDFRDFALPEHCELRTITMGQQVQYDLYDRAYRCDMHTFVVAGSADDVPAILNKFCARMQFLKRKLLDDLASGEKIFVYKSEPCADRKARKLARALRRHGVNRLLFVREFGSGPEPGHGALVRTGDGIVSGYLERFDVHAQQPAHVLAWQALLDGALREFAERPARTGLLDRLARGRARLRKLCAGKPSSPRS